MQDIPDCDLLDQFARNESEEAFGELVRRHLGLVHSVALRHTENPLHAEEISQAVFIILARKAATIGDKIILSGWLYHTARLTAANFRRSEFRRLHREQEAFMQSTLEEAAPDPAWLELAPLLDEAMAQLGATDRDAVVLRYFENKTLSEVGAAIGLEERAAQKRVSRALEKLRKFLAKHGVASPAAILAGTISRHSIQAVPAALAKTITAAAILKGAAASSSTATLINGALKVMAWSKAKIAMVAGAIVLLAAGTTDVAVTAVKAARSKAALYAMQGSWEGVSENNGAKLRVVLKVVKTNDVYRATIDSIDQGAKDLPAAKLSAGPHSLHVEFPALDADYQATLSADGTELSGTWTQIGQHVTLALKRTAEATPVAEAMPADDYTPRAGSDLQGAWETTLHVQNIALRLHLRIAEPVAGTFHAQMDSIDQGAKNLPVDSVTYNKPAVKFEMQSIGGVFEGTLNDQHDQLAGTWTQMGMTNPSTFKRFDLSAQMAAESEKDYGQGASDQVQGHWKGTLMVNKIPLHLVFHIARLKDGSYSADMDSPDQGVTAMPASKVKVTAPNVHLDWNVISGYFEGKLDNGKLNGTWHQSGVSFPLKLERGAAN